MVPINIGGVLRKEWGECSVKMGGALRKDVFTCPPSIIIYYEALITATMPTYISHASLTAHIPTHMPHIIRICTTSTLQLWEVRKGGKEGRGCRSKLGISAARARVMVGGHHGVPCCPGAVQVLLPVIS